MRTLAVALFAVAAVAQQDEAGKRWWSHVQFLADDALEGRKPGTEGYEKAARYVASQFDTLKLKPGGTKGWFQTVPFDRKQIDESKSTLALVRDGKPEPLDFARDAHLGTRGLSGKTVEAEMVFVGYGLRVPEAGIDDLTGVDLKGKIAVILRGAPKTLAGPLAAHSQSTAELWRGLREAGAIGIASIFNANRSDIPWARTTLSRAQPSLSLAVPELNDTVGQQISVTVGPDGADRLFAGTGHTYADLLAKDKAGEALPKFPIPGKLRATPVYTQSSVVSDNVVGVIEGTQLRDEIVVFSAHLDHVGVGEPINGDRIYNGAMDNASGIASLIEVARAMQGKQLKRTVVFAAVTGEESGLLGSKYFAYKPSRKGRIVANVNTDMFLPIMPLKGISVLGLDESDLGDVFAAVSGEFGVPSERDPQPQRNSFTRSDQYSFIRRGIPALAFKFHAAPGTPEADIMKEWLTKRYHAPSDDLQQPVNIDGAAQFNRIMAAFLERVANQPQRPAWKESSFFKRFAK